MQDIPTIIRLAEATWEPTYRFIISEEQLEYLYRVIYSPAALKRQMQEQHHVFLVTMAGGIRAVAYLLSPDLESQVVSQEFTDSIGRQLHTALFLHEEPARLWLMQQ